MDRQIFRKLRILGGLLYYMFDTWRVEVYRHDLDERGCCDGRECGCGAATLGEMYGEKSKETNGTQD